LTHSQRLRLFAHHGQPPPTKVAKYNRMLVELLKSKMGTSVLLDSVLSQVPTRNEPSDSIPSAVSHLSVTSVSTSLHDEDRCFIGQTLFQTPAGFRSATDLKQFDYVCSGVGDTLLRVMSVRGHKQQEQHLVELTVDTSTPLTVTGSHRVMIHRGGQPQHARADFEGRRHHPLQRCAMPIATSKTFEGGG
jgi:hypothetical protein